MRDRAQALIVQGRQYLQLGDHETAFGLFRRAVRAAPRDPAILSEMGMLLFGLRRFVEARDHFAKAAAFGAGHADHHANLGAVCAELGDAAGATRACLRAVELRPGLVSALMTLARVHAALGDARTAATWYLRLLALGGVDPPWRAEAHLFLRHHAEQAAARGDLMAADIAARGLIALDPADGWAWDRLGVDLALRRRPDDGLAYCARGVAAMPDLLHGRLNRAGLAMAAGHTALALAELRVAAALQPDGWIIHANRGAVLDKTGDIAGAIASTRRALAITPDQDTAWANLIAMGLRSPDARPDNDARMFGMLVERQYGVPPRRASRPGRGRLRIGYYSPDLRRHSCACFIEPLLAAHDRDRVEITAYAEVVAPDDVSARLQGLADRWRVTCGIDDDTLAAQITEDGIDLLVDLAGHFAGGRPRLFARKPAPVQANWLGFNATTGLRAIDWKIVDRWLAPESRPLDWFAEGLWRLPRLSHCWRPAEDAPVPTRSAGRPPSFGSFNSLGKLSEATIALWSRALAAVPTSRLVLKADQSGDGDVQLWLRRRFGLRGVDPDRLVFLDYAASTAEHLALYGEIDVALDPIPYNGTTTTCEALWMGVPVVALAGDRLVARVSASLLGAIDLTDFVAADEGAYVDIAAGLLGDPARLAALRGGLRDAVAASPLRDENGFARAMETAYMEMIQKAQ